MRELTSKVPRLSPHISKQYSVCTEPPNKYEIGVLQGEGIGPEVIDAALKVLRSVETVSDADFSVHFGGCIGNQSEQANGNPLSHEVESFCEDVFDRSGAVLSGPGGGRYVYDLRRKFKLFCKLNPLSTHKEIKHAGVLKPETASEVDIVVVRENMGGVYQGQWGKEYISANNLSATHKFSYSFNEVARIVEIAASISNTRKRKLTLVVKPNGVPSISELWLRCAKEAAGRYDLELIPLEIDFAAYQLIQNPRAFDVVVTPNLFGDIMSDLGGVLLGSRGLCYAGNFSESGCAVYQTNHGAAYDLANSDRANPVAQILSLSMMLRESFGLQQEAEIIENAISQFWSMGFRTEDIREPGCLVVGTRETGDRIAGFVLEADRTRYK